MEGKRKFVVWAIVEALVTGLLWFGKVDSSQWMSVNEWTFMFFIFGNSVEHLPKLASAARGTPAP